MRFGQFGGVLGGLVATLLPSIAGAAEARERPITTGEIEGWLEAEPGKPAVDQGPPDSVEPLPAPREHGLVLESGIGFSSPLGELAHLTPTAPRLELRVGYEFLEFLMPFVEADLSFASTAYASEPPPPRSYWHYGGGAGLRLTLPVGDLFGLFAQASLGLARVSEQNVLSIYGFPDADEFNLYYGGALGFEWYQVNPHLALAAHAGLRSYGQGLTRERGGETPLALLGSLHLRYAF